MSAAEGLGPCRVGAVFLTQTPVRKHSASPCLSFFRGIELEIRGTNLKVMDYGTRHGCHLRPHLDEDATIQARYPLLIPSRILGPVSPGRRGLTIVR